jgi:shikimate dehydrogenase
VSASPFRVALLGEGVGASLTPAMHEREGRLLGLDYRYDVVDVAGATTTDTDLARLLVDLRRQGYRGLNVTHPFKQRVIAQLDQLDDDAARLGAVNLVRFTEAGSTGHNTDWTGFRSSLRSALGEPLEGGLATVLQVGAGGAGAATAYALLDLGTRTLGVHDVDGERALALVERCAALFPAATVRVASADDALRASADGVVHATPVGMDHHPGLPFDPERLRAGAWLAEVVYRPVLTELVVRARASGRRVVDGSGMAAGQAVDSLRLLTGREPDAARVRAHLVELLAAEAAPSGRPLEERRVPGATARV